MMSASASHNGKNGTIEIAPEFARHALAVSSLSDGSRLRLAANMDGARPGVQTGNRAAG
jgi:hypothetical protein